MKSAAIYARVSSARQKEEHTIASQTVALIAFAQEHAYHVPREWRFEDEGFSGASLERPGLECIRDLAAKGQLQAVLVYSPDRLSRKYAYQVLLMEEFARHGVETVFVKAPQGQTAEDQLLVQFQGMIAEYERAQILERSRRGKRHRAQRGDVNVLSGAPYGYRYVRKTQETAAYYEIIEAQAVVVRSVYAWYTSDGLSIAAIVRRLNEQGVPTCKGLSRWERSTVWAMLRNPAYKGLACFGKTKQAERQRITRPLRLRGGYAARNSANHERPREEWIEIPVPAIVSETVFDLAQERLQENRRLSSRRTVEWSIVQGLVSCSKCGYGMCRTSTRTSARKIHYYRCLGSDGWRHLNGPLCDNRPVRQDLLDQLVWDEVLKLLQDPTLIQHEIEQRLAAARDANPTKRREESLQRELTRTRKGMERLVTAYQEALISLEELRARMPELQRREQTLQAELKSINDQTNSRAAYLRLSETLTTFLTRLRSSAHTLDIAERQRIVRLLVKEVLVGDDTIIIRHSIPIPSTPAGSDTPPPARCLSPINNTSYLLRSGSDHATLWHTPFTRRFQNQPEQLHHVVIVDPLCHLLQYDMMPHRIKVRSQVEIDDIRFACQYRFRDAPNRILR
jgi:site-specific DNA recombinase